MLPLRLGGDDDDGEYYGRSARRRRFLGVSAYARRLLHASHMDIEATSALMLNLVLRPSRVARAALFHRQTKGVWARDDPAFVAIQTALLAVSALAWSAAFAAGYLQALWAVARAVFVDYALAGAIIATAMSLVVNRFFRAVGGGSDAAAGRVEWGYAWDCHCNGFFPAFLLTHVVQLFLAPLLLSRGRIAALLSALLYGAAGVEYVYVTFLGYRALPFLQQRRTTDRALLYYPVAVVVVAALLCPLFGFNISAFSVRSAFPH